MKDQDIYSPLDEVCDGWCIECDGGCTEEDDAKTEITSDLNEPIKK